MTERMFTADDKLKAIEREIGYRRHVYPRRVMDKKMTQELADKQIAVMEAIAEDYRTAASKERLL